MTLILEFIVKILFEGIPIPLDDAEDEQRR